MARIHAVNHSATGRFVKANSGYQLRKQARERIRLALLQEFDFSSATSQVLLPVIVGHLFEAPGRGSRPIACAPPTPRAGCWPAFHGAIHCGREGYGTRTQSRFCFQTDFSSTYRFE
jgi:hypothetical protein